MTKISFTEKAFDDYQYWQVHDIKLLKKINDLLKSISRDGASDGIGKPEKLRGNLEGYYSRRINHEHRLVYRLREDLIKVIACRYHYEA